MRYVFAPVPRFRFALLVLALGLAAVALAGCGGGGGGKTETDALSGVVHAACNGSRMSAEPKLPPSFPQIEEDKLTYTQESEVGPTQVVEGYFNGDVQETHDEFQKELKGAGSTSCSTRSKLRTTRRSRGRERAGRVRSPCGTSAATARRPTSTSRTAPPSRSAGTREPASRAALRRR